MVSDMSCHEYIKPMAPMFRAVQHDFFKKWSSEMAYVLGFFAADGNLTIGKRGNYYLEFNSTDKDIIEKIRSFLLFFAGYF